jgi:hypothetical protein
MTLTALLVWVIFGNAPEAPEYPPLKAPSASVSTPQHPGGPEGR